MKKRRILILGASLMQKPAITEAKRLGCEVVAVDANKKALCVDLVDRFEAIDLKDVPHLIQFAKELARNGGLSAVFTAATDFSASVAAITDALKLPGHSLEAAKNASDKVRMRECFAKSSVASPSFVEFDSTKNFSERDFSHLLYPLVVKPVDNMGARGCKLVKKIEELELAIKDAVRYSRSGRVIVEEFIEGSEFSIEGLVFEGDVHITALADRHIYFSPYFIEMGHTIPSTCDDEVAEKVCDIFCKGVKALGLSHGACKGDIFFDSRHRRAVVGEIAARLSGGYMSGWTVPYSSNLNITCLALQLSLGEKIDESLKLPTKYNTKYFASERAYLSIDGIVKEESGIEKAKNSEKIKDVFPRAKKGDVVQFPKNNVEKCGNVISVSENYENAISASRNAIKNIFLRLEPCNDTTDIFLESFNDDFALQEEYPPNFFIFPTIKTGSLVEKLTKGDFIIDDDIVYPAFFSPFLDVEREPMGESIREALKKAFKIEERIKERLIYLLKNFSNEKIRESFIKAWVYFVRGGTQGLVYWFDSYKNI